MIQFYIIWPWYSNSLPHKMSFHEKDWFITNTFLPISFLAFPFLNTPEKDVESYFEKQLFMCVWSIAK